MSAPPVKPVPVPDERSAGYWAAAGEHVLAIARCSNCGRFAMPPGMVCSGCLGTEPTFVFEPVSGAGTIRSWTIIRQAFLPGFVNDVPYVLVDVELDEQADLRMIGRLVDGVDREFAIGDRVTVAFDDRTDEVAVPGFTLTAGR